MKPSVTRAPDYETIRSDEMPFPLSDEEKGQRGLQLAELNSEILNLELQRRATVHKANEALKQKRGAMKQLGEEISNGVTKSVRCQLRYFDKEGVVARFDVETGEFMGERDMNDMDRQLLLDLSRRSGKDKKAKGEASETATA